VALLNRSPPQRGVKTKDIGRSVMKSWLRGQMASGTGLVAGYLGLVDSW